MATKKTVKAKALLNLKYDKDCFEADSELKIRIEDAGEMSEKGYIELLGELPEENEGQGTGEPPKEGEQ
ncbi:hypothetical protein [Clostridium algidicarnis]|uniref:hypothetical protein n=1 Tax=Clostridium algidicarnis TaxID=37659 RepID=UPI001C0E74EB|nr:hypothetical protein [Clostridium algidicarnis]MBU3205133.1 hypothetical protein [Clostridium algidicarnis]MBU3213286.1 hypothetical protein [Clostridium algidicarnis]MBU3223819.1 hypothetical protein [Clostridium algidicarnis]